MSIIKFGLSSLTILTLTIALPVIPLAAQGPGQDYLIENAQVFDGTGAEPFTADIYIEDGVISAIGEELLTQGDNVVVIDGTNLSVLPGLIDIHTHWVPRDGQSRADIAATLLRYGVTTVDDYHSMPESYEAKRTYHSKFPSPHIVYAARMGVPGGHGADWADHSTTRLITSAENAQAEVSDLLSFEPDIVKVFADGWRYGTGVENSSIDEATLTAIVAAASRHEIPTFTHTVTVARAKIAARAGVDAIVHAIQDRRTDSELVELMQFAGVVYAPTLAVYEPRPDKLADVTDPVVLARIQNRQDASRYNLAAFLDAGVEVALGSDSGIASTPFGESTVRELELLVEFGMTPEEALIAGTKSSAAALQLTDRGTIEVGKRADLLLVSGRPWKTISDIRNVHSVIVGDDLFLTEGKPIESRSLPSLVRQPETRTIDDFEKMDRAMVFGAARRDVADTGHPRSEVIAVRALHEDGDHMLRVVGKMAPKEKPFVGVGLPLSPGSFFAIDAGQFKGVSFDLKGDGGIEIALETPEGSFVYTIVATPVWRRHVIPFDAFRKGNGTEETISEPLIQTVMFRRMGHAGERIWFDLDEVAFYD